MRFFNLIIQWVPLAGVLFNQVWQAHSLSFLHLRHWLKGQHCSPGPAVYYTAVPFEFSLEALILENELYAGATEDEAERYCEVHCRLARFDGLIRTHSTTCSVMCKTNMFGNMPDKPMPPATGTMGRLLNLHQSLQFNWAQRPLLATVAVPPPQCFRILFERFE